MSVMDPSKLAGAQITARKERSGFESSVPLTKMVAGVASDISGTGLPLSVLLAKNETDMGGGRGGK